MRIEIAALREMDLQTLEEVIQRNLPACVRVGQALCEIRDRRLFLEKYSSFEEYCRATWGICRQHGYRLIQTSKIAAELSPNGDTGQAAFGESQLRALARLKDPQSRRRAFDLAVRQSATGRPTAVQVKAAVNRILLQKQVKNVRKKLPADQSHPITAIVIHGDTADPSLVDPESVDLIIGSPPYNIGARYATVNDFVEPEEYLEKMKTWLINCWRWAVREGGRLCLNVPVDTRKNGPYPFASEVITAAQNVGWNYEGTIVWDEGSHAGWNTQIDPVAAPVICCRCEVIILFSKGGLKRTNPGRLPDITPEEFNEWSGGYWNFPGAHATGGHPCRFPAELPRRLIKMLSYPGDTVLDPWCGSGTTLIQAVQLRRYAVGIDAEEQYCQLTESLLAAGCRPS